MGGNENGLAGVADSVLASRLASATNLHAISAACIFLETVGERCAELDFAMDGARPLKFEHFMSNNFAFGGINTSLVFRRV